MTKNNLVFLLIYFLNLAAVIILIAFVIESTLMKILLGIYLMVFSTVFSFICRRKEK